MKNQQTLQIQGRKEWLDFLSEGVSKVLGKPVTVVEWNTITSQTAPYQTNYILDYDENPQPSQPKTVDA